MRTDGVEVLTDHIQNCVPSVDVTVVAHQPGENLDDAVQMLLDEGWTLETTEYVAGKRLRTLRAPVDNKD